jgi:hypothetical protein
LQQQQSHFVATVFALQQEKLLLSSSTGVDCSSNDSCVQAICYDLLPKAQLMI